MTPTLYRFPAPSPGWAREVLQNPNPSKSIIKWQKPQGISSNVKSLPPSSHLSPSPGPPGPPPARRSDPHLESLRDDAPRWCWWFPCWHAPRLLGPMPRKWNPNPKWPRSAADNQKTGGYEVILKVPGDQHILFMCFFLFISQKLQESTKTTAGTAIQCFCFAARTSSNSKIWGFLTMARAMAQRWRCPPLSCSPFNPTRSDHCLWQRIL